MIRPGEIFGIQDEKQFTETALDIFRYQARHVPVYREYTRLLKTGIEEVRTLADIPFLPIRFFKSHAVIAENQEADTVFYSSGTTGSTPSRHPVAELSLYRESFQRGFGYFYGDVKDYVILALLPGYLEREGSSLILMVEELMKVSGQKTGNRQTESGFFLREHAALHEVLIKMEAAGQKSMLIGVSYALLDFVEKYPMQLRHTMVMETGGMKGKREEMIRKDLHRVLKAGFGVERIHSEYGMTELLSQAWSKGEGYFQCPPWMKVLTREINDPFSYTGPGRTGGLNIIDLANLYSCSFIATDDLGKVHAGGSFEVLGRFDHSEIRGCNLMADL